MIWEEAKRALLGGAWSAQSTTRDHEAQRMAHPGRVDERFGQTSRDRPKGPLVWVQAVDANGLRLAEALAKRLDEAKTRAHVLVTHLTGPGQEHPLAEVTTALHQYPPLAQGAPYDRFTAHWAPDLVVWTAPLDEEDLFDRARGCCPHLVVNMRNVAPWLARRQRRALRDVDHLWCSDADTAETLMTVGLTTAQITQSHPIIDAPDPPPCSLAEFEDLNGLLKARPIWLAACPTETELDAVIAAHASTIKTEHRALLLLTPDAQTDPGGLGQHLIDSGWRVRQRIEMEDPDGDAAIYITEPVAELGLWYRLASVTFLGGTLSSGAQVAASGPAALGSALIAGPNGGPETFVLAGLEAAGGLRRVKGPIGLARATSDLMSPSTAADQTHGAWSFVTQAAEAMDGLVAAISKRLGRAGL